jgi:hypothetical protein
MSLAATYRKSQKRGLEPAGEGLVGEGFFEFVEGGEFALVDGGEDYAYWRNRFGNISPTSGAGGSLSTDSVPEPGSAALVMSMLWSVTWLSDGLVRRGR